MLANVSSHVKSWATMRSTNDREVDPRLVHLSQNFVLNTIKIIMLIANGKEKRLPDVVTASFRRVVSNRRRRVFTQDAFDRQSVVSVDPIRQLIGSV